MCVRMRALRESSAPLCRCGGLFVGDNTSESPLLTREEWPFNEEDGYYALEFAVCGHSRRRDAGGTDRTLAFALRAYVLRVSKAQNAVRLPSIYPKLISFANQLAPR
jgi:hypothetical protein